MIVYELACPQGHRFEGWFASSGAFAAQKERDLVRCPVCDVASVERVPSARVSVSKSGGAPEAIPPVPAPATANEAEAISGVPPEVIAKLREIVRNTENVGRRFPEEARKIHYEEVPPRAIRGQASTEEAQALREEGIDFASLPSVLTSESH
jgi:hypothetical protein